MTGPFLGECISLRDALKVRKVIFFFFEWKHHDVLINVI